MLHKQNALISCVVSIQLICGFCFCVCEKAGFLMTRFILASPYSVHVIRFV